MFITFEGTEGSGKTVNIAWLAAWLTEQGISVISTREPGGTMLGEQIRSLLLDGPEAPLPYASLLLFQAARAQLVGTVIWPAIATGSTVLCDRFTDSTLAYQGYGEGVSPKQIRMLNELATGGLVPDLTLLFDLDPVEGLRRRGETGHLNTMDRRELEFHQRVRDGYLVLAGEEPERWLVLDAAQPLDVIHECVLARIHELSASARL